MSLFPSVPLDKVYKCWRTNYIFLQLGATASMNSSRGRQHLQIH
ncbi:hypothetical protein LINGRAPRIM_LOCUS1703 [Linum grandiflorum]